ncbi:hypothetical protein LguiB_022458 [Lonicera macranthoides]
MLGTLAGNSMDVDLMDELLYDGCWLETTDGSNIWQPDITSSSPSNFSSPLLSFSALENSNPIPQEKSFEEETERSNSIDNPPLISPQPEELFGVQTQNWETIPTSASASSTKSQNFLIENHDMSKRLWIGPSRIPTPNTSMKKRLVQAFEYLKESTRDRDVLIQIWVPIKKGDKRVLSTKNQPFSFNPKFESLAGYRDVSRNYNFPVEADSKELAGLPGRVFMKKLPEWTPDVRFFKSDEYPRVNYAQQYNVSGSLALPVFERGSGTCLGVIEIVTTTQTVNYRPELENVCKALEAVDLRSSEISSPPQIKDPDESYRALLAELQEVLKSVCDAHELPLAQTWAPCNQQGKGGCRHTDQNYTSCISIVDSASYVPNKQVSSFHEACAEHHLLRGEGVAGGAFLTNQLCFAPNIRDFSKTEYPLSHHARLFDLRAAVAMRVRSSYTGSNDFILEFFLPWDCEDGEEQNRVIGSLLSVIQQVSRSLRVVADEEVAEETAIPEKERDENESPWIASTMDTQSKGKGVFGSFGYDEEVAEEEEEEEYKVATTHWNNGEKGLHGKPVLELKKNQRESESKGRKVGEKRRKKTERTISLQVLRQYFSGSLKEAAKSIGVCPTTLKRICRQHGISRWPSRKIKKVGHSLKKLQLVIDSVQGAEGAIQLSSFYTNFPELSSSISPATNDDSKHKINTQPEVNFFCPGPTASKSLSSSTSHSSGSSFWFSTGAKHPSVTTSASGSQEADQPEGMLKRAKSDAELHDLDRDEAKFLVRSHSDKILIEQPLEVIPPLLKSSSRVFREKGGYRVKATLGEEKIRFSMPHHWGLGDLKREIVQRFNIEDISKMDLKYLDDDSEWVLLTCDADLEECIDVHRLCSTRTIKITLHHAVRPNLGSSFESKNGQSLVP